MGGAVLKPLAWEEDFLGERKSWEGWRGGRYVHSATDGVVFAVGSSSVLELLVRR
jgi:hypothetical protein